MSQPQKNMRLKTHYMGVRLLLREVRQSSPTPDDNYDTKNGNCSESFQKIGTSLKYLLYEQLDHLNTF